MDQASILPKSFHLFSEDKKEAWMEDESGLRLKSLEFYSEKNFLFVNAVLMPHPAQTGHTRKTLGGIKRIELPKD